VARANRQYQLQKPVPPVPVAWVHQPGPSRDGIIAGYVLKLARESINHTQVELAQQLGIDPHTLHSWEIGRRPLAATHVRDLMRLRSRLFGLGVDPTLVDSLNPALEADYILSQVLAEPAQTDVDNHPLCSWLLPHTVSEMLAWPLTGAVPSAISSLLPMVVRRGPVARGPTLSAFQQARFFHNLSEAAALSFDQSSPLDDLHGQLAHQLYLRVSWNQGPATREWLRSAYDRHRRRYPRFDRWSPHWLELRSFVIALAYLGDPEPIQRFIRTAHGSEQCEMANVNYWAYWIGELPQRRRSQEFMISTHAFQSWTGATLLHRLTQRLQASNPYLELNIHSITTRVAPSPSRS
jgi:transcriptional regulator with XRE-family HTH domain